MKDISSSVTLPHIPSDVTNALADLEIIYRAVFGYIGDEPDVYADYDRCVELSRKMMEAIVILRQACAKFS